MKIWLDLELKADIDDLITLIYALENDKDKVSEVSIHNPTLNELKLMKYYLNKYQKDLKILYTGRILEGLKHSDINKSLLKYVENIEINEGDIQKVEDYLLENKDLKRVVFGGGAYTSIELITRENKDISCYLQGGYAGEKVVGSENVLEKFKGRDKVPSFNPNLDYFATTELLKRKYLKLFFISKNVCHNSFLNAEDFISGEIKQVLKDYFKDSKYDKKCMHDLVAYMSIFRKEIIVFKNVELKSDYNEDRKKILWWSEEFNTSNVAISISLNMDKVKEILKEKKENGLNVVLVKKPKSLKK
jgi:hypothetical protein